MRSDSLLFHRDFRRLWTADTISQVGTAITAVAMPLMAVRTLHASPFQVGLLTTFEYLAFALIGLPAGAWVDRMRRRSVMVVADLGRALVLGSIPVTAALHQLTIWQMYAVVLVTGALTVFFDVSYQSYLPFLVGRTHLVEGNAKLQGTQSVAQIAGPGIGGLLVQVLTAPFAIAADAASYLWSAVWVGAIGRAEPRPERADHGRLVHEIREGVGFITGNRLLRSIAGSTATANLFQNVGQPMLIVLLARQLDLSAGVIGALFSAFAVGGILGAVVARRLADRVGQGVLIWLSMATTAPFPFVMPFLHRNWTLGLFVATQIVWWAGVVVYNVTQVSFRQALCPERLLGRMNATMRFFIWGTIPVGGLLGGVLGSTIGVRPTLLVAAVGSSLAFLWTFFSPLRWMRELPTSPEQALSHPSPAP